MKILGATPTRNADFSQNVVRALEPHVDAMLVASQGTAEVPYTTPVTEVVRREDDGVCGQRNFIVGYAIGNGFDYVIQVDHDVICGKMDEVVTDMIAAMQKYPWLAQLGVDYGPYWAWSKGVTSNMSFRTEPYTNRLIIQRCTALEEAIQHYPDRLYDGMQYAIEDHYLGLKLWGMGWVVGVDNNKDRDRIIQTVISGRKQYRMHGIEEEWKSADVTKGVAVVNRVFVDTDIPQHQIVKFMKTKFVESHQCLRVRSRYIHKRMHQNATERWGDIGYLDSRKRSL